MKNYFNDRAHDARSATIAMLDALNKAIGKVQTMSDGCCKKQPMLKEMAKLKVVLAVMIGRLERATDELIVKYAFLKEESASIVFFGDQNIENLKYMTVSVLAANYFFGDKIKATEVLWHDLSHVEGTDDTDDKLKHGWLMNADYIDDGVNEIRSCPRLGITPAILSRPQPQTGLGRGLLPGSKATQAPFLATPLRATLLTLRTTLRCPHAVEGLTRPGR